jgi:hypothetical protein
LVSGLRTAHLQEVELKVIIKTHKHWISKDVPAYIWILHMTCCPVIRRLRDSLRQNEWIVSSRTKIW